MNKKKSKTSVIIFSRERDLQLTACLTSLYRHVEDIHQASVNVLHHSDSEYKSLKEAFLTVNFIKETDFQKQVTEILQNSRYCLFMVDDSIMLRNTVLKDCIKLLQYTQLLGVSLRLGKNTNYCFAINSHQQVPFCEEEGEFLIYDWKKSSLDFSYALEVSSSLYRSEDILLLLKGCKFSNPNELESVLIQEKDVAILLDKTLLGMYRISHCTSIPLNSVQLFQKENRTSTTGYTKEKLKQMYDEGYRLDVAAFDNFIPYSVHQDVTNIDKYLKKK